MAKNENKRLAPTILEADKETYSALNKLENYSPANPAYSITALETTYKDMQTKQDMETQTYGAYQAARDNANATEWAFHNLMLGLKDQVKAQFGKDSNEIQSLGLKKKTEYKKPVKAIKKG
jgi:hypothetical protein